MVKNIPLINNGERKPSYGEGEHKVLSSESQHTGTEWTDT